MKKHAFIPLVIICLLNCAFWADGQKLPNKQETGVYAPTDVKIDGSVGEWQDHFQAYNHAIEVSYTMANDETNLYLVFRAAEKEVIQKIITGGITISVSTADKKSRLAPVSITYPVVPFIYAQVNYALKPPAPLSEQDVLALNKKINDHLKEIKVTGVKSIPDSSVSIYNDLGIKGAHHIDNQKNYTCEMGLPLTLIRHLINNDGTFAYRVQVTGIDLKTTRVVSGRPANDPVSPSEEAVPHGLLYDTSPTYFTAMYTLAKKP